MRLLKSGIGCACPPADQAQMFSRAPSGFHAIDRELAVERVIRLMTAQNHLAERQGLPAARRPCTSVFLSQRRIAHAGGDRGEECGAQRFVLQHRPASKK